MEFSGESFPEIYNKNGPQAPTDPKTGFVPDSTGFPAGDLPFCGCGVLRPCLHSRERGARALPHHQSCQQKQKAHSRTRGRRKGAALESCPREHRQNCKFLNNLYCIFIEIVGLKAPGNYSASI